ncbi:hypothetical protein MnTg02_02845 [bacterium MnTg02]|nr:hypothetical protein MnTg02_02845 [bacterium MnTg02]
MMACLRKTFAGIFLNQASERLFRRSVAGIRIEAEIFVAFERLGVIKRPGVYLICVNPHLAILDPG